MASTTFSHPEHALDGVAHKPSWLRRAFQAMIEARTRQAEREIAAHIATMDEKTLKKYDIGDAVVGKNGVYAWPF